MIHSDALERERVAIAVEHLIHGLPIERKDPKSALSPASYVRWELNLSNALKAVAEKEVDPAMTTLSAIIDRTWGNDEQSALALVKQIQKTLPALGEAIAENAIPVTEHTSKKILTTIRKELGATKKFGHMPKDWVTTWTLRDERALDILARKPAFWIGQRYETKHIEAATRIIDASLDLGLGTDQTAVFLKESLGKELADYHYWDVLSSAVVNRSRTSGVLYAMQDAGFEIYQILTAGDDAVCDVCEHMAGQQFSIQESIDTLEGTFELENPEDLKDITPWLGWDEKDGEPFYKDSEGKRHGVGNMSSAELQKNGIGQPPFHGLCRCTIVLVGRYGRTFTGAMSIDSLAAKLRQWPPAALSRARIAVLRSAPRVAGELVTVSFGSDGATIDVRRGASQRLVHGAIARAWVVGAKDEEVALWRTWAEKDALAVPENGFAARELMASQLALYVSGAYDYIGEGTERAFTELLAVDIRERNERLALCRDAADDHE